MPPHANKRVSARIWKFTLRVPPAEADVACTVITERFSEFVKLRKGADDLKTCTDEAIVRSRRCPMKGD
jgi:hypothetical protein